LSRQTHRVSQLIVVEDDFTPRDQDLLLKLCDGYGLKVRIIHSEKQTLGFLRQIAVNAVQTPLAVQWDDDDQSHPNRLFTQLATHGPSITASFLTSQLYWFPADRELHVVSWDSVIVRDYRKKFIPGTIIHRVPLPLLYPEQRIGEDSVIRDGIDLDSLSWVKGKPWLYMRVCHGQNTWDHDRLWANVRTKAPSRSSIREMLPKIEAESRFFHFGDGPVRIMHRSKCLTVLGGGK